VIERFANGPGGAEIDALRTVTELLKRGHEVTVVCRTAELGEQPGLHIECLAVSAAWQPLRVRRFSRLAGEVTKGRFDVVHSFARTRQQNISRCGGGSHAQYMERVYRHPRLQRALSPRHRTILKIEEAVFRDSRQLLLCIAKRGAEEIADRYAIPAWRIATIYNGVDTERFTPDLPASVRTRLRAELRLSGPVVLFVGGGFWRKGLDRAIHGLACSSVRADLIVIGGGADKEKARRLAQELGVAKRVHLLGHRSDPERWHAASDLLLLPTRYDPFGNVVLEGMASGLPVATTLEAGAAELIEHGENGLLYDNDFTDAFEQLRDPDRLASIGRRARKTAERFSWSNHVEDLLRLYQKVQT